MIKAYERGRSEMTELKISGIKDQAVKARRVIDDILTEKAKATICDLRKKRQDIIVLPGSKDHISRQKDIDARTRRKLAKDYGQETLVYNYIYSKNWRKELKNILRNKAVKEFYRNLKNNPRILLYLPVPPGEIREIFEEKGFLFEFRDIKEHITIISEGNIPEDGIIDEVMHVILAKALLNYERFRQGDYGDGVSLSREAAIRLESFIKALVDNPGDIDIEKDPGVINRILDGEFRLRIRRLDFQDIIEWKHQQDSVLVSL